MRRSVPALSFRRILLAEGGLLANAWQRLARVRLNRPGKREGASTRERGALGERMVGEFLSREKGFRILARNWRSGRDEIDLVCLDGEAMVFVEVKTRRGGSLVPGYFAVNRRKKEALLRVCRAYLKQVRVKPKTFRLDVVEVVLHAGGSPEIHHFETVRLFPKDLRFTR